VHVGAGVVDLALYLADAPAQRRLGPGLGVEAHEELAGRGRVDRWRLDAGSGRRLDPVTGAADRTEAAEARSRDRDAHGHRALRSVVVDPESGP